MGSAALRSSSYAFSLKGASPRIDGGPSPISTRIATCRQGNNASPRHTGDRELGADPSEPAAE